MDSTSVDRRPEELRKRLDDLERHTDRRFDRIEKQLNRIDGRIDSLQRSIVGGGMIATFAVGFAGLIATQL